MKEVWLPVVGFEDLYEVSDHGRLMSLHRARVLQGWWSSQGRYLQYGLYRDGQRHLRLAHRLVMEAFVGPCPEGMEVLHGDAGHRDNRLSNLKYGTHAQNCAERVAAGTQVNGLTMKTAKLNPDKVRQIRELLEQGRSQTAIGKQFNVSQSQVSHIKSRRSWAYV